jgi:flavin-dependent dehydrogenase
VALVGDAAGYLDAITGEGLSIGFRSALALIDRFHAGRLSSYEADHARLVTPLERLTTLMLLLSRHSGVRRRLLGSLERRPELLVDLLGIAAGSRRSCASRTGALLRWLAETPGLARG